MLTFLYFLFATIYTDSTAKYEQLTADHFFEVIWKQKYGNYKSIEFDNKTDTSLYILHIYGCEKWNDKDKKEIEKGKTRKQFEIKTNPTNVSIRKMRSNSKRLKLAIGTRIHLGDTYVVQIEVYRPYSFVDHFFIKFDGAGRIIDKCEFGEII